MTGYEAVEVNRDGAIGRLTLCRPYLQNRFDEELLAELAGALDEFAGDDTIRAVVFASTGKHFSAGGDTASMLSANTDLSVLLRQVDNGRHLFRTFAGITKPLICALHGDVFGVATSLVLTSDALVSTPGVRIGDPHVHFALVAGDGGCVTWPAHLPLIKAKRHLLWGEPILAEEAYRLGMVTELADSAEGVLPLALDLAERIAALPPVAVQLTKRALNSVLAARIDEVFDIGFYLEAISATTEDLREAVAAFAEKRPGQWSGR